MPGLKGDEISQIIKNDSALNYISIILMCTSFQKQHINYSVEGYLHKPVFFSLMNQNKLKFIS